METADLKTLWIGDVQMNWDEAFISSLFANCTEQPTVKIIRDKVTGYPAGYGFLEFQTQRVAQQVLEAYNGQPIPNTMQRFRLNWGGGRRTEASDEHSIFVGDLAADVNDELLMSTFSARFPSVRGAKVVMDPVTRMPKGFGFVRFGVKEEADQALQTMNGVYCSSRPMRVCVATDRQAKQRQAQQGQFGQVEEDSVNTTVFIGGLEANMLEEDLRCRFADFGDILSIKVPPGRGCGFVQYATRESAEMAIAQMNGAMMGNVKVRCAWGRSAAARVNSTGAYYNQYAGQYGYHDYYGYGGYYPQQYQHGAYAGYSSYGYGGQHGQMPQGYQHGYGRSSQEENLTDFTKPEDHEAMNRRYASQRAYQHMPPPNGNHLSMSPGGSM